MNGSELTQRNQSVGRKLLDRFLGAVLGTFVGDALGEPVEGWSHEAIYDKFGLLTQMIRDRGRYTDDTQMMIGILETLAEKGTFDPAFCADRFRQNFDPARGYGRRIHGVMARVRQGVPWDQVGTDSFGNGAAMRIAPIGCFYYTDLEAIKENAMLSARITHTHPEGLAGAVAQATAVGLAFKHAMEDRPIDKQVFIRRIVEQVGDVDSGTARAVDRIRGLDRGPVLDVIRRISREYELTLRAIASVPASIAAFVLTDSVKDAVVLAVNLGGDTDTIGAMTGAIAGAYYGYARIPDAWLDRLENGEKGKSYVIQSVRRVKGVMG